MFGSEAKVGLISLSLPNEVIARLQTEDDLQKLCSLHLKNLINNHSQQTLTHKQPMTTHILYVVTASEPSIALVPSTASDQTTNHETLTSLQPLMSILIRYSNIQAQ